MKLNELVKAKKLSFWAFIEHMPEDDEGGKKIHYHVYLEPSAMLQSDDVREFLKEYDPEKPDKPKGCLKFNSSNFPNWYMYVLHDKKYLASKGESRKYHYKHEDMIASDDDDLRFMAKTINLLDTTPYAPILDAIEQGLTWDEFVARGQVPIQMFNQWKSAWKSCFATYCNQVYTERNGHENHPMEED